MMTIRMHTPFVFLMAFFFFVSVAHSQETPTPIASSPNPVGSGARALGMGGAFIAVADDATAASWNPGGLIQLETPEVSMVLSSNRRREKTGYAVFTEASGTSSVSTYELNYLSAAWPFTAWGRNMIVSLNYQHLYDFRKEISYGYELNAPPLSLTNKAAYQQDGALSAVSPAFAVQITPRLSIGAAINIWDNNFCSWESTYRSKGEGILGPFPFQESTEINEKWDFSGYNFNLGFLWHINGSWTLGGVFKSPFRAGLDHTYRYKSDRTFAPPAGPAADTHISIHKQDRHRLDMPMSLGLGVAWRVNDNVTLDLDLYHTRWDDYVRHTPHGTKLNPVTGKRTDVSRTRPTTQVRLGGEYLFIGDKYIIPFRAGVFYDPEPSEGGQENFFGAAMGSGIAFGRFVFDVAYQYRFGRDVKTASFTVGDDQPVQDVDQHTVYMSVIVHW